MAEQTMKYFVNSKELVAKDGKVIHRFNCPAEKRWEQLMISAQKSDDNEECRYCDRCNEHVFDISELDENNIKELIDKRSKPCLHIDFGRSRHISAVYGSYQTNPFETADSYYLKPRKNAFCVDEINPQIIRVTDSIDVMQQFLENAYELVMIPCLPENSIPQNWLRLTDNNKLEIISDPDLVNVSTDYQMPVAAYIVHPDVRPGDEVRATFEIDPLALVSSDKGNSAFSSLKFPYSECAFLASRLEEQLDTTYRWDGSKLCDLDNNEYVYLNTVTELHQMQWALDKGYELQLETRLPVDKRNEAKVTEWLIYNEKTRCIYKLSDSERQAKEFTSDEREIPMPVWAYVLPSNLEEGTIVWIDKIIARIKKCIYGTRSGGPSYLTESDYISSAPGQFENGKIEVIYSPQVIIG